MKFCVSRVLENKLELFKYSARNASGQMINNVLEAENIEQATLIITHQKMIPINITKIVSSPDLMAQFKEWQALNNLNINDLMLFSRQMYSLSKAGVPLHRALGCLIQSTRNKALANALKEIAGRIEAGSSLSQAMNNYPKIFNSLFINIINVGEMSGNMDRSFLQIADYLQREKETQGQIKAAFRYPIMVLIAISAAMLVINIYVIPAFKGVYDNMHTILPWQTNLLISVSKYTVTYWPYMVTGVMIVSVMSIKYINTLEGRLQWDWLMLHLPVVGSIVQRSTMERFSRSFAMSLKAGVPLLQGITIVSGAIGNSYIASKLQKMRIGIEKGDSISRMARSTDLFPPLVIQMIIVGEEVGNIGDMLIEVADFYKMEVDAELKNISTVIEPILIVIIGMMVLVLALGIFLPMWDLASVIH
jgi:MSHA biogenesis protein MshG